MPTHGLLKVLGPLAETGNLSTQRQGISTLQRNPCKMRQTTDFLLDQKLLLLSTLPPTLIQNLDFCLGPRQWHKAAPRDNVCKGNPSLFNPGMNFVRDSISPHILYLSHPCTPTVKAGGKAIETQTWIVFINHRPGLLQLPALGPPGAKGRHLMKTVYL